MSDKCPKCGEHCFECICEDILYKKLKYIIRNHRDTINFSRLELDIICGVIDEFFEKRWTLE